MAFPRGSQTQRGLFAQLVATALSMAVFFFKQKTAYEIRLVTGVQTCALPISVPVQVSAGSHAPAEARHSTVAGAKASAGQSSFTPSQLSATSQGPALARHSAVLFASAGQAASVPVQVSAGSHTPADGRHST